MIISKKEMDWERRGGGVGRGGKGGGVRQGLNRSKENKTGTGSWVDQ